MIIRQIVASLLHPINWGLRDYGIEGQIGLEQTPEEYVEQMVNVFREVKRVLKPEGTLWLNLGDSYATTPPGCKGVSNNSGLNGGHSLNYQNPVRIGYTVRRLTPLECERLQGYPDGWTEIPGTTEVSKEEIEFWRGVWYTWDKMQSEQPEDVKPRKDRAIISWLKNPTSDTAQYKALGNSVAVPCTTWIMGQIANKLRKEG